LRERPGDYGQLARRRLMAGAFMSAGDYVQAARRRLQMVAAVEDALRDVDVLLCASAMDPPSRLDDPVETERTYPRQARTPFNVTGHPALAMMAARRVACRCRCNSSAATSAKRRCFRSRGRGSALPAPTSSIRR
jgi:aspartyl-tRNA(Asn)/glutamyl-tRNA(Gln) amidotransferase subunit A